MFMHCVCVCESVSKIWRRKKKTWRLSGVLVTSVFHLGWPRGSAGGTRRTAQSACARGRVLRLSARPVPPRPASGCFRGAAGARQREGCSRAGSRRNITRTSHAAVRALYSGSHPSARAGARFTGTSAETPATACQRDVRVCVQTAAKCRIGRRVLTGARGAAGACSKGVSGGA